jgi:hypothetical protein
MLDSVKAVFEFIKQLPPEDKAAVQSALITHCIITCVYYVVLGLVAFLLGRRLIQAFFAAWREAKRERI